MSVVAIIGFVVLGIITLLGIAVVSLWIATGYYAFKLLDELPLMRWLTLNDVQRLGYSRILSALTLPILHKSNYLECRPLEKLDIYAQLDIKTFGFGTATVKHHEFRLLSRPLRRRQRFAVLGPDHREPVPAAG